MHLGNLVKPKFVLFRKASGQGMIDFLSQWPRRAGSVLSTSQRTRGSTGLESVSRFTELQAQPEGQRERTCAFLGMVTGTN